MPLLPRLYVTAPTVAPRPFGLFSVSQVLDDSSMRWENGTEHEPVACTDAAIAAIGCEPETGYPIVARDGETTNRTDPFVVIGSYQCAAGSRPIQEAEDRARLHLSAGLESAVEFAIASGGADVAPNFTTGTDLTPGGGAVTLVDALGRLESHLATAGHGNGVMHAPRQLGPYMADLVEGTTAKTTTVGTLVAFGAGYDVAGFGDVDAAASEFRIAVTGTPVIRLGSVFVNDPTSGLDKGENLQTFLAQRTVAVSWDCGTAFIDVDVTA